MAWWVWACWVGAGVFGVGALGVLYVALVRDRSRGRRRCPRCWYDMSGVPGLRCPECGREARRERGLFRTRRRWGLAAAGVGLLAVAYAGWVTPGVVKSGKWWAAVPRPVLVVAARMYDDQELSLLKFVMQPWGEELQTLTKLERLVVADTCASILRQPPSSWPYVPGGQSPPWDDNYGIALSILSTLGRDAWPAFETITQRLDALEPYRHLTDALAAPTQDNPEMVRQLARLLQTKHVKLGLWTLVEVGPGASIVRPEIEAVMDQSAELSDAQLAAIVLAGLGSVDYAIEFFGKKLRSPEHRTRKAAVEGLATLLQERPAFMAYRRSHSITFSPVLRVDVYEKHLLKISQLLKDAAANRSLGVSTDCIAALSRRRRCAIPVLTEFVASEDVDLAADAAAALWQFGAAAAPAVPALTRALASTDLNLRNHASVALGMIGPDAEPARAAIEAMLKDPDPRLRAAAADALKMIEKR